MSWKLSFIYIIGGCLCKGKVNLQLLWSQNPYSNELWVREHCRSKLYRFGQSSRELISKFLKLRMELEWQLKSPHVSTAGASISWLTYMNASTASASSVWRGLKSVFPCWGTEGLGLQLCQFDTSWQHRPPSLALCFLAFLSNVSCFLKKEIT